MKQIICSACGNSALVEEGDYYVCPYCDSKFKADDIKKTIFEGNVEISGSKIKLDKSDEINNLFKLARRARDTGNLQEAVSYYNMILIRNPSSWEAYFYSIYFKAMNCKICDITCASEALNDTIKNTVELVKESTDDINNQKQVLYEIVTCYEEFANIIFASISSFYKNSDKDFKSTYLKSLSKKCTCSVKLLYTLGDTICNAFSDEEEMQSLFVSVWKSGVIKHDDITELFPDNKFQQNLQDDYIKKIQKYDSSFRYVEPKQEESSGWCYIATAVYGSYDCPQVWTLRRYRDTVLAKNIFGRVFIHTYYALSPILVKLFGKTDWFKRFWKNKLDRMIAKLNAQGIESTKYEDTKW